MMELIMPLDCRDATRYGGKMLDCEFWEKMKATKPIERRKMRPKKMIEYQQYCSEQLPNFDRDARDQQYRQLCQNRIDDLRSELQRKESARQWRWTIFWTVSVAVATIVSALVFH